jgi:hypothetical protein
MKIGLMIAMSCVVFVLFSGVGLADMVIKGKVVLISGISNDMYTVKTDNAQGFGGSEETFYVDPKMTKKTGEIKVGTDVEVEVNTNGTAYWIKSLDEEKDAPKSPPKKPAGK